jgi:RNA polymerase sigma factor (sigma-70 family)
VAEPTDAELVERYRRTRDEVSFERLFGRHRAWVTRVCGRLLRSDSLARDAAQDVFVRAIDRIESLQGDNFAGWLKAIAVNHCLNIIDREKRWAPLEAAGAPPSPAPAADVRLLQSERLALAARIIGRMPERQRIVFCMKYIDGCSYEDIERLTGFSANEVKSYVQNARRNFENWRREEEGQAWPTKT